MCVIGLTSTGFRRKNVHTGREPEQGRQYAEGDNGRGGDRERKVTGCRID